MRFHTPESFDIVFDSLNGRIVLRANGVDSAITLSGRHPSHKEMVCYSVCIFLYPPLIIIQADGDLRRNQHPEALGPFAISTHVGLSEISSTTKTVRESFANDDYIRS
jgi:hypothetical protein